MNEQKNNPEYDRYAVFKDILYRVIEVVVMAALIVVFITAARWFIHLVGA